MAVFPSPLRVCLGRGRAEAESLDSSLCRPAVSLLKDLKHANIVTLHDIIHTDKSLTLVFEYLVRTTRPSAAVTHLLF